ncbi:hypothetical protein CR969_01095 [Candidatus Saccharibacteria bacterium]|nr:MAG: hypothetical protein CR969_01095 [Candidatus Saccharibacteria bacterium]
MKLLRVVKQRPLLSEITYYALNIGLAVVLLVLAQTIQSPAMALALVLLSKWRVFAIRPRHWWNNIQANMVDTVVGLGVVILMFTPAISFASQLALAVFYAIWLVVIKPLHERWQMTIQAALATIFGSMALFSLSYQMPLALVVFLMWALGYSVARHFLYSYDEEKMVLLSLVWGIIFAELGWLAYHWTFSYAPLKSFTAVRIPQITIILVLVSFLGERVYSSWRKHKKIAMADLIGPAVLTGGLILVILLFFNSVTI